MIGTVEDIYRAITRKRFLYNITTIANIPSIMRNGILCHDRASRIQHTSVAIESVQSRRAGVKIPNGHRLHQYANLYFDYHNPMLSYLRAQNEELCILALSASVLDIPDCIVSDRNAAVSIAMFYPATEGVDKLDYDKIFAQFWLHPDNEAEERNHKAIKCAEILIPDHIPYKYVSAACVVSEAAKEQLIRKGFNRGIIVDAEKFF